LKSCGFDIALIGSTLKAWGGARIYDEDICKQIEVRLGAKCINTVGEWPSFMHLMAFIHCASCYIGLDTGPTHLAALLGVPVVELYAFIDEQRYHFWKLTGKHTKMIVEENLNAVSVEDVASVVWQQMAGIKSSIE